MADPEHESKVARFDQLAKLIADATAHTDPNDHLVRLYLAEAALLLALLRVQVIP